MSRRKRTNAKKQQDNTSVGKQQEQVIQYGRQLVNQLQSQFKVNQKNIDVLKKEVDKHVISYFSKAATTTNTTTTTTTTITNNNNNNNIESTTTTSTTTTSTTTNDDNDASDINDVWDKLCQYTDWGDGVTSRNFGTEPAALHLSRTPTVDVIYQNGVFTVNDDRCSATCMDELWLHISQRLGCQPPTMSKDQCSGDQLWQQLQKLTVKPFTIKVSGTAVCVSNRFVVMILLEDNGIRVGEDIYYTLDEIVDTVKIRLGCFEHPKIADQTVTPLCGDYQHDAVGVRIVSPSTAQGRNKQSVKVVGGVSGSGKTLFGCFGLPSERERTVVLWQITDTDLNSIGIMNIEKAHKDITGTNPAIKLLKHRLATSLLYGRYNVVFEEFADALLKATEDIFTSRNQQSVLFVIEQIKRRITNNCPEAALWVNKQNVRHKLKGKFYFVIDEIGKCPALARGIIASRHELFSHPWITSHFDAFEVVLVGTGSEECCRDQSVEQRIATDPRAITMYYLQETNQAFCNSMVNNYVKNDTVRTALMNSPVFSYICGNARMLALVCKQISAFFTDQTLNAITADLISEHVIMLLAVVIKEFCSYNGLGSLSPVRQKCVDAALYYAFAKTPSTIIPIYEPPRYVELIEDASLKGLFVKDHSVPHALLAVATFAFESPHLRLKGDSMEEFSLHFVKRLIEIQDTENKGTILRLQGAVPTTKKNGISNDELCNLIDTLRNERTVVIKNGEGAPGADIIVLQLRPHSHSGMTKEAFQELWGDNSVARITLLSIKATDVPRRRCDEVGNMGMLPSSSIDSDDLYRQLGPLVWALCCVAALEKPATLETFKENVKTAAGHSHLPELRTLVCDKLNGKKITVVPVVVCGGVQASYDEYVNATKADVDAEFGWVNWTAREESQDPTEFLIPYFVRGMDAFGPLSPLLRTGTSSMNFSRARMLKSAKNPPSK